MSVCFSLMKVLDDVDYIGDDIERSEEASGMNCKSEDEATKLYRKLAIKYGAPISEDEGVTDYDAYTAWCEEQEKKAWSDGVKHDKFDINYIKSLFDGSKKSWKRTYKKLKKFKFKRFKDIDGTTHKYLSTGEVLYRQGWFLKKPFFKRDVYTVICVTKEQMNKFFSKYLDTSEERGLEAYKAFNDAWQDGYIFECSW